MDIGPCSSSKTNLSHSFTHIYFFTFKAILFYPPNLKHTRLSGPSSNPTCWKTEVSASIKSGACGKSGERPRSRCRSRCLRFGSCALHSSQQQHLSYFLLQHLPGTRHMQCCIHTGGNPPNCARLGRRRNLCASVASKTGAPPTASRSRFGLAHGIIGWGFRWKGTAGEKAFLEGGNGSRPRKKSSFQRPTIGDWDRGGVPSWLAHLMARLLNFCIHQQR